MVCELCGKEANLYKTLVEGTELDVCKDCAQFGKILQATRSSQERVRVQKLRSPEERIETIVEEYASKIREAREKRGLLQKELAIKLAERESVLQKLEAGQMKPSIDLAKKLEKHLGVSLIKEEVVEAMAPSKSTAASLTLGDLLLRKNQHR